MQSSCLSLKVSWALRGSAEIPRMAVWLSAKLLARRVKSIASLVQPGRVRAWIEKQHKFSSLEVGQRNGLAAVARQAEGGGLCALRQRTYHRFAERLLAAWFARQPGFRPQPCRAGSLHEWPVLAGGLPCLPSARRLAAAALGLAVTDFLPLADLFVFRPAGLRGGRFGRSPRFGPRPPCRRTL